MSWNVNSLGNALKRIAAHFKHSTVSQALQHLLGDHEVVLLQETRIGSKGNALLKVMHELPGWDCFVNDPRTGANGVATFVRSGLTTAVDDGVDRNIADKAEGRCLTVHLEKTSIVNVYIPSGTRTWEKQESKIAYCNKLEEYVAELRKTRQ
ncbi:hypothetical protein HDU96_004701, partial [Phlyctochytrium bullatum]